MKSYIFLILTSAALLTACRKDEVMIFQDGHEVYFEKFYMNAVYPGTETMDSTVASFFFTPEGTTSIQVPLVVGLSGRLLTHELTFGLKVVPESTTAEPEEYDLAEKYVFRVKAVTEDTKELKDTLYIKMNYSDRLDQMVQGVVLTLELVPGEEVSPGQLERRRARIILTSQAAQPEWWDEEVTRSLLGIYSQKKYKLFLKEVDRTSRLNADLIKKNPDQAIQLVMQFKAWLGKQNPPIKEEDGSLMKVEL